MGSILLSRNSLNRWLLLINCSINIIIASSVIINSVYYIKYNEYGPISRFLRHMILYIASYIALKILPLFCMNLARLIGDQEFIAGEMMAGKVVWYPSNLIFFLTRLCEPHIREYLKEYMRYMVIRFKVWYYKRKEEDRTSTVTNTTLLASEMFDEMKLKKIEQIFLAVSISYFKSPCYLTPGSSYSKTSKDKRLEDEYDYEFINQNDLNILNDPSISQKCNIYIDQSVYIEYKRYGVDLCQ